jgi:arylsulfatase A-like enzyme
VLLFLFDAAAARHFTPYGYSRDTTPNVQRLAGRGYVFRNHFSVAPYTLSSMASLMTALYPPSHAVIRFGDRLGEAHRTLPEAMRESGRRTGGLVWNPFLDPDYGFSQGFDVYVNYQDYVSPGKGEYGNDYGPTLKDLRSFLAQQRGRPFFLLVHVLLPHNPYAPPQAFRDLFLDPSYRGGFEASTMALLELDAGKRALDTADRERLVDLYDANLRYGDHVLGEVLGILDAAGRTGDTHVIVTADHGEALGEHGRFLHNTTVYDEMIHVPLVLAPASPLAASPELSAVGDGVDVFPTILDLLGMPPLAGAQGRSLLQRSAAERKPFALSYSMELAATSLRSSRFKYIRNRGGEPEYYSLVPDPGERHNVLREDPARYERAAELEAHERRLAAVGKRPAAERRAPGSEEVERLRSLGYLGGPSAPPAGTAAPGSPATPAPR